MKKLTPHKLLLPMVLASLMVVMLLPVTAQAEPDAALKQSLEAFFAHGISVGQAKASLIHVERWPDTHGAVRWKLPNRQTHTGRISLIAEQGTGQHIKRWYVPVRVHWWATAMVANQSLSARTLLTRNMMKQTRTDIADHRGHWWQQPANLEGMQLIRPLQKGQVILSHDVKKLPLIRRGDPVQIVLDTGSIHITTAGQAMRSASRGERILVKNIRSNEIIQAIAENNHTVRVTTGGRG